MERLIIALLTVFISCSTKVSDNVSLKKSDIDSAIMYVDTTSVLGDYYKATVSSDSVLVITNSSRDTVFSLSDFSQNFEFRDFDNDGNKDLLISYMGNVPTQDLFLFDVKVKTFKQVKYFRQFSESNPIVGTRFYYSYHRSGCADMNWDSDLFYIDQFVAYRIGNISGRECDGDKRGIYISKIDGDSPTLIETLPIETIDNYPDNKWELIKEYWTSNYMKFADSSK